MMLGLVLAAMIGSMDVAPALGDDGHDRRRRHDNHRYEHRGRGHDRDRHVQRRRVYRTTVYREQVYYAPPPVIYEPPPPPGISIFFPSITIRP
jgi:hypothetical protein